MRLSSSPSDGAGGPSARAPVGGDTDRTGLAGGVPAAGDPAGPSDGVPAGADPTGPSDGTPARGDRAGPSDGTPVRGDRAGLFDGTPARGDRAGLFDGVLAAGDVRVAVGDAAWVRAMLDAEAALARAAARCGLATAADADAVTAACAHLDVDPGELGAEAAGTGNPVVPLLTRLRAAVPGTSAALVHRGATSQDIVDTAAMLVAHRALVPLLADLTAAAQLTAALAERHRGTVMAGRTLLQQALPTTFGLVAAGWLTGLDSARRRLVEVREHRLAAQLGGAAGTLAAYGDTPDPAGDDPTPTTPDPAANHPAPATRRDALRPADDPPFTTPGPAANSPAPTTRREVPSPAGGDSAATAPAPAANNPAPTTPGPDTDDPELAAHRAAAPGADPGVRMLAAFSAEVGLPEPDLPWHTERTRIADLAGALGAAAGAIAKVARDLVLLAQTEVGEVAEGGDGGGSSTLPHKHNPIAAVSAAAAAAQAPGLVATLLTAMAHEHQRAAGNWHAEWQPLRALLTATGSAAHQLRRALADLRVDAGRMRANLELTHGALLAERVAGALGPALGAGAHATVRAAVARGELATDPAVTAHLDPARLAELLAPETYVGSADALIDRALRAAQR